MSGQFIISQLEEWMKKYHLPLMPVIWGTTCLIIGVLVVIGIFSYYSAEKAMAEQFNRQQLLLAGQAALGIESFLSDLRQDAALLPRFPEIHKLMEGNDRGDLSETLQVLYKNFARRVDFLFWIGPEGKLHSSFPAEKVEEMLGKDYNFQALVQRAHASEPVLVHFHSAVSPISAPAFGTILITIPVFRGPEFAGMVGCGLDFRKIYERFIPPIRFGVRAESWMINQEGKFISHYDPNMVGKDAFLARKERNPEISTEWIDRIMREKMLAGKTGMEEYGSGWQLGERGKTRKLIAYAPVRVEDQVWSVALVVPYSEVTRVVWGGFQHSAVLIVIMALTLVGGTYLGHKINQQRIRAEEKVKWGEEILKSQKRLQALFDGAPDAIAIVDRTYRILTVNKTALNWYKKPVEDFTGKPCYEQFQGRTDLCPNCPAEESFRTGQPAFRERASLVAGGNKYYLQLFTFPLCNREGEVIEVVEYVKDVTAEKELQRQMIQSERLAVVGRMAANVAHEIKNPLGTIVLNAEMLEEELGRWDPGETAEGRELLGVIKSELDRLIEVVEEYLQFARLPVVKLEPGSVNEVVSDLLSFLKEEVAERNVLLVEDLQPDLPPAEVDAKQLRQALLNIVKNSFEAMPQGGKLTVTSVEREGRVEITVADTGKGISEDHLDLVFTPFFSTKHGGTGLGLSITSHIIKEHRGTIGFQSYPDLGTTFTIRIPLLSSLGAENEYPGTARPGIGNEGLSVS